MNILDLEYAELDGENGWDDADTVLQLYREVASQGDRKGSSQGARLLSELVSCASSIFEGGRALFNLFL